MPIEDRNQRLLNDLGAELEKIEKSNNKVYIDEFLQYRELFIADTINTTSRIDITELSKAFFRRFDLYRAIEIYDRDDVLLFKVPQILFPINGINEKFIDDVNHFKSEGISDIPKYAAEATKGLVNALIKSQADVTEKGHASFGEYLKSLSDRYKEDAKLFTTFQKKQGIVDSSLPSVEDEGSINDIEGIVWK